MVHFTYYYIMQHIYLLVLLYKNLSRLLQNDTIILQRVLLKCKNLVFLQFYMNLLNHLKNALGLGGKLSYFFYQNLSKSTISTNIYYYFFSSTCFADTYLPFLYSINFLISLNYAGAIFYALYFCTYATFRNTQIFIDFI